MGGRNVMMGYLFCEKKTNEAIDKDGWLHSGKLHPQIVSHDIVVNFWLSFKFLYVICFMQR